MISNRLKNRLKFGTSIYSYLGIDTQGKKSGPETQNHGSVPSMTTKGAETAPSNKESTMDETNAAPAIVVSEKKQRKPMTPEQRAKKNEGDRLRRARQKAAREASAQPTT
jgi:hypothetical protein